MNQVNSSGYTLRCQSENASPAPAGVLDDALQEIRAKLGFAPARLYESNGRFIRFGRGKSGWAFVRRIHSRSGEAWLVRYGDWRTRKKDTWRSWSRKALSEAERLELEESARRLIEECRKQEQEEYAKSAHAAKPRWENLPEAPDNHPYLQRKGVQAHGLKVEDGSLVVPLRDITGQLWSLQFIAPDGRKRFLKGGRTGGTFFTFGTLEDGNVILLCEGWATGATLHEATGLPTVAAMNCGNLLPVARALKEKYPQQRLVICADDDWKTESEGKGNPGIDKAREVASAVGAAIAIPVWTGNRGEGDTDFNDLALAEGTDAVRRIVEAALAEPEARQGESPDDSPSPATPTLDDEPDDADGAPDDAPDELLTDGDGGDADEPGDGGQDGAAGGDGQPAGGGDGDDTARRQRRAVAQKAERMWGGAKPAQPTHPYLRSIGAQPHNAREFSNGTLILPLYDAGGRLWNLRFVQPDGESWRERSLKGGRMSGLFCPIGELADFETADAILVCPDWETGALLRETTGLPVAVSPTGKTERTARALAKAACGKLWKKLVLCVHDDPDATVRNAAAEIGAVVLTPPGEDAPEDGVPPIPVSFREFAERQGRATLRQLVFDAVRQCVVPGKVGRPFYWRLDEPADVKGRWFREGLYFCDTKKERNGEIVLVERRLAKPIKIEARTTGWDNRDGGVRLSVRSEEKGGWQTVFLLLADLASPRYRGTLMDAGAELAADSKSRQALEEYLQLDSPQRESTTRRIGWHGAQYVLPDRTFGDGGKIWYVKDEKPPTKKPPTEEPPTEKPPTGDCPLTAGTLEDWQKSVAALAVGNSILTFSISLAFVGPLLKLVGRDAVIIHLFGHSSAGKSTCLRAANSVVGPTELVASWCATASGLEQKALDHCDSFLALDEISEADEDVLGQVVYALANGVAKQRAMVYDHGVGAAPTRRWRVAVLSTGEETLEARLAQAGRSVSAGQAVRFIEIPVDERHGAFTELHGYQSAAELVEALDGAAIEYYGTPIRAFLEQFVSGDWSGLDTAVHETVDRLRKVIEKNGTAVSAQSRRVLTSMALVALAGELATRYGITGWPPGTAFDAVRYCYQLWAQSRPTQTDHEEVTLLRRLRRFIAEHGDSRFSPATGEDVPTTGEGVGSRPVYLNNPVVYDRAGYYRDTSNDREYLFTPDGLRKAVDGFDFRRARQELEDKKVLIPGNGHNSQTVRVGGTKVRVYVVSLNALNRALEQIGGAE